MDILLHPNFFDLEGFDNAAIGDLAERIDKRSDLRSTLQGHIIESLANRTYFALLFLDLYTNALALTFYLIGSHRLLEGTITYWEPTIMSICVGFFLLREIMQYHSQWSHYIVDIWSWQQNVCIGLLITSLKHMFQAADEGNNFDQETIKRRLLIATGGMLIAQVIFFLRSTFLPFARFVGGLLLVFNVMVPFFIVSLLLLLAFAYCFRVWVEQEECTNLGKCFMWVLQVR